MCVRERVLIKQKEAQMLFQSLSIDFQKKCPFNRTNPSVVNLTTLGILKGIEYLGILRVNKYTYSVHV